MAKIGFNPQKKTKSKRHITLDDCENGDIIYLEEEQIFGIIIDEKPGEKKVADLSDGDFDWYTVETICRKFIGEINFDVEDFVEFI